MGDLRLPVAHSGHTRPVRACVYCRLSRADDDDTTKVDDQADISMRIASTRNWVVDPAHVFKDNNRSAWKRNRKRPGWDAMLAAVERGELEAIIIYHGDRLIRQPWDLELLLRLAEDRGILLASPTGTRNLDSADDRFILRIEAAQACKASDDASRRIKRALERLREQGLVRVGGRGGRAFGFEKDGQTHVPAETAVLRELALSAVAGEGVYSLCRALDELGITTTAGNPWSHRTMRDMLMRPRYAGLMPDGVAQAAWEPVFDEDRDKAKEVWVALCAVLTGRVAAFPNATSARKYWLPGIAVCGAPGCGEPVESMQNNKAPGYRCVNPKCEARVSRNMAHVDTAVRAVILRVLADEDLATMLSADVDPAVVADLAAAEARKEGLLADLADADDEAMRRDLMRVTIPRVNQRIAELQDTIAEQRSRHELAAVAGITGPEWDDLPLERRRAVTRRVVRVELLPTGKTGRGFRPESVRITPLIP